MDSNQDDIKNKNAVDLYIEQKHDLDHVKKEVSELLLNDMKLGQKIDQISERINEGVSKTAYNTWVKVSEIASVLSDLKHDNEKRDIKISNLNNLVEWFYKGVIFVLVIGFIVALWKFE
jgi:hypothetical protein